MFVLYIALNISFTIGKKKAKLCCLVVCLESEKNMNVESESKIPVVNLYK